jgi:hypothetical protein
VPKITRNAQQGSVNDNQENKTSKWWTTLRIHSKEVLNNIESAQHKHTMNRRWKALKMHN